MAYKLQTKIIVFAITLALVVIIIKDNEYAGYHTRTFKNYILNGFITRNIATTRPGIKELHSKQSNHDIKTTIKSETTISPQLITVKYLKVNTSKCIDSFSKWYISSEKNIINNKERNSYIQVMCVSKQHNICTNQNLTGLLHVHENVESHEKIMGTLTNWLSGTIIEIGGWISPLDCQARSHTAIVVPFRNREEHLPILLRQLFPILSRQKLHARVFIIEQTADYSFNRAKLMNIGFKEALKYFPYDCFVFHDVDLIPEDDRIDYSCKQSPMHLSVAVSTLNYQLPYQDIFGGVSSMSKTHFEKVNGFSNSFWKWGGEDDNLAFRLKQNNLKIHRQSVKIGRYKMIKHAQAEKDFINKRRDFLKQSYPYIKKDGLNTLQYDVVDRKDSLLFTLIKVNLRKEKDKLFA